MRSEQRGDNLVTSAGRAGPGMAAAAAERRARPCLLLPAVHPVLGAAGGDDLRQEAIRLPKAYC